MDESCAAPDAARHMTENVAYRPSFIGTAESNDGSIEANATEFAVTPCLPTRSRASA